MHSLPDSDEESHLRCSFQVGSYQVEISKRPDPQTLPLSRESSWRTEARFAKPIIRIKPATPSPTPPLISDDEAAKILLNLQEAAQRSPGFPEQQKAIDGAHALFNIANHRTASTSEYSSDEDIPSGPIICHGNYFDTTKISESNAIWDLLGIKDPSKPYTEHSPRPTLDDHNGELQCPRCSIRERYSLGLDGNRYPRFPFHNPGEDTEPLCSDAEDNLELRRGGAAKYNDAHYKRRSSPPVQPLGNLGPHTRWPAKEVADKARNNETEDTNETEDDEPTVLDRTSKPTSQSIFEIPIVPTAKTLRPVKTPLESTTVATSTHSKSRRTGRTAHTCGLVVSPAPKDKGLAGPLAPSPGNTDAQCKTASTKTVTPASSGKKGKAPARITAAHVTTKSLGPFTPSTNSKTKSFATASTSLPTPPTTITKPNKRKAPALTLALPTSPATPGTPTAASKKRRVHISSPPSIPIPAPPAAESKHTLTRAEESLDSRIAAAKAKAEAILIEEEQKKMMEMEAEQHGTRLRSQRMKKKTTRAVDVREGVCVAMWM